MTLSDLVTLQNTAVASHTSKNRQTADKINTVVSGFESFLELTNSMKLPSGSINFNEIYKSVKSSIDEIKKDNIEYALTISNKSELANSVRMRDRYESGKYINYVEEVKSFFTPDVFNRSNLDNVKELANKLGLLIIPVDYVNDDVLWAERIPWGKDSYYHPRASAVVSNFSSKCEEENLKAWLICPLNYYDISAHANNTKYNFFVPDAVSQSFNAVKLIMPMLISMSKQIEKVAGDVKDLQGQLKMLKEQLKEQQKQIDNLQIEINNLHKRQAQEEAKRNEEFKKIMEAQQTITWAAFDPMLIAVPNTVTDINSYEGRCFIGPAWGPEIDTVLLQLHGITKNKATASYNEKMISKFR